MTIDNSSIVNNSASGDVLAQGGGIYNGTDGGTLTINNSSVVNNVLAQGGEILNGGNCFFFCVPQTLTLTNTNVNANRAIGDGASGVGGGLFNNEEINIDKSSNIHGNKASTSHDNVFGNLKVLDEVLALV